MPFPAPRAFSSSSSAACARYSFVLETGKHPGDGARFEGRHTPGGGDNFEVVPAVAEHTSALRLDRCGSLFIGYALSELNPDTGEGTFGGSPGEWVELGRQEWMSPPESVLVGLAVDSWADCELTTITFEGWELARACASGAINLTDGIVVLNFLFTGGCAPACLDAVDTNDSGAPLNLTDAVGNFSWRFQGGRPPSAPSPNAPTYLASACGADPPGEDRLDCAATAATCR